MSQQELLKKVIQILDKIGIQYMITGSIASSLQGEPRSTHDIDIIVAVEKFPVDELLLAFPDTDFYLSKDSILDAIKNKGVFNLLDIKDGSKVDFWILTDEPYDQTRFSRRYIEEISGVKMNFSTPEDTILAKLYWAKLSGGSEKQFTDALRIFELQFGKLDIDYIEHWTKKLKIEELWDQLKSKAEIIY
ncbi:TPA: hypothetical protein ENX78_08050 [Candidatus Poribacteria bacterium]|nr:hypothetical protein [Candidatus Poribacteria bacterium]